MTAEGPKPVAEFTVPTDAFVLATTLEAAPETIVEFERLVPVEGAPLPYLWSTDTDGVAFEGAAATDSTVAALTTAATSEQGTLYRIQWSECENDLLGWLCDREIVLLQSKAQDAALR